MNENLKLLLAKYMNKEGFKEFMNIDDIVMFSLSRGLVYTYDGVEIVHLFEFNTENGYIAKYIHNPPNQNTLISFYDIAEDKIVKGQS